MSGSKKKRDIRLSMNKLQGRGIRATFPISLYCGTGHCYPVSTFQEALLDIPPAAGPSLTPCQRETFGSLNCSSSKGMKSGVVGPDHLDTMASQML